MFVCCAPERHANANLVSLQCNGVAHHAEDTDDYQDEADDRECREGYQFKLRATIELAEGSLQRSGDANGDARIYIPDFLRHTSQNCASIHRGPGDKCSPVKHLNAVGDEGFGKFLPRRIFIVARLVVRHDADDFKIGVTRGITIRLIKSRELDLSAERVFVGKILTNEGLVYNHDVPACVHVVFGKIPAMEQRDSESLKIVLADGFIPGLPAFHVRPAGNNNVRRVGISAGALHRIPRRRAHRGLFSCGLEARRVTEFFRVLTFEMEAGSLQLKL